MTITPERLAELDAALSDSLDGVRATAGACVLIAVARWLKRIGREDLMLDVVLGEWLPDCTGETTQKIGKSALERMAEMMLRLEAKEMAS